MKRQLVWSILIALISTFGIACDDSDDGDSHEMNAGETAGAAAGEVAGETAGEAAGVPAGEVACEVAGEVAGEAAGTEPEETLCDRYCDTIATHCVDDHAQFDSRDACIEFCETLPEGNEGDTRGDTAHCRLYHDGDPSALDPVFHCLHAGEDGGGVCVDEPPRPCDRLCANAVEAAQVPSKCTQIRKRA